MNKPLVYSLILILGFVNSCNIMPDEVVIRFEVPPVDVPAVETVEAEPATIEEPLPIQEPIQIVTPTATFPSLGYMQAACVNPDGSLVQLYTAEYDWEWRLWKSGGLARDLENYNRDNDPDASILWGPGPQ